MSEQHPSKYEALFNYWKKEEVQPFSGWDFSYLADRCVEEKPPWSYEDMVRELLSDSASVLDIGTGGGEKLLKFRDTLPPQTVATEGYRPNYLLARERLEPYGITVVECESNLERELPFDDASFDLVINRHTAFNLSEVERVLTPGGTFLTQQVDGNALHDLSDVFGYTQPWTFSTLDFVLVKARETTDLEVKIAQEWAGKMIFRDVGAIVYHLKAVPWTAPQDFSVERYHAHLERLQQRLEREGELAFCWKLLLVRLKKEHLD